ncbi:hypothetical protein [Alicyclobacillus kakegawensis]|uniref:hypothetical protein n=1 Tax=Alicyclobacillus kakegawensis TaxID=392012 RepID=UPI0012ED8665|nr:hypothetical protein [Alicyclobacillus kakegawensis]
MHSTTFVSRLPRAFIYLAFFNFLIGSSLGGWMAEAPAMWSTVGPIHGEINPFGWLTMLIYGMTYAVLSLFAGIRPARAWVGWLHVCLAEAAVIWIVVAYILQSRPVLSVGLTFQAIAPVLFFANIWSAVVSSRRDSRGGKALPNASVDAKSSHGLGTGASERSFRSRDAQYLATDRLARRGTDIALIIFVVGAWWAALTTLFGRTYPQTLKPQGAILLEYYGWIAATVLAVSLHMLPRLTQFKGIRAQAIRVGQALWGIGLLLAVVGTVAPVVASAGSRLLGASFIWNASIYLWTMAASRPSADGGVPISLPTRLAWLVSFAFAWLLGGCLLFGIPPLSLFSLHLLFLGWITTLVYGIGYRLFPLILNRPSPRRFIALAQLLCSVVGATLMAIAFSPMSHGIGAQTMRTTLATGGILAALGAVTFLLQWLLPYGTLGQKGWAGTPATAFGPRRS